jgi:uncharacterized integral membrane protein (TIGR00698 family)
VISLTAPLTSTAPAPVGVLPGLALAVVVAAAGYGARFLPGLGFFSPMILAILIGMVVANLRPLPEAVHPGLQVAMRPVLRTGIVLLGLQITPARFVALGGTGLLVVVATLVATFAFTAILGRRLGVAPALADLVAAGSSICGASAVVAMNGVANGDREEVAQAVATVTIFGTLSMFAYPALGVLLGLGPHGYGLWAGASIHEIAQVVAAGFQGGPEAGEFATVAKLVRVALMAPLVIGLGLVRHRGTAGTVRPPFPWFVVGFVVMVGFGGLVDLGPRLIGGIAQVTTLLLTVALGAMGLMVDGRRLIGEGWRTLLLGALSWLFVSGFSLAAIVFLGSGRT